MEGVMLKYVYRNKSMQCKDMNRINGTVESWKEKYMDRIMTMYRDGRKSYVKICIWK